MNIGIVVNSISRSAGGLQSSVRGFAESLQAQNDTAVAVFAAKDGATEQDISAWTALTPRVFSRRGPRALGYTPGLAQALHEAQLEVLHTQGLWQYPSLAALRWAQSTRRPYLVSPRGMLTAEALRQRRWKKRFAARLYENAHLRGAACLHALSLRESESLRGYGLKQPICVIPNGIELPPQETHSAPPWPTHADDGRKTLLYLGRWHGIKNLSSLFEAWRTWRRRSPERAASWRLVLAGWGTRAEATQVARWRGVQDSVTVFGPLYGAEKRAAFAHASAFVLPSRSGALPMAVLEAWSHGLPVLMTPECGLPEGFAAGAALRIECDAETIAAGLEALAVMTDDQRQAMGERGRALVRERFAWPRLAVAMREVYAWVLGGGARPSAIYGAS